MANDDDVDRYKSLQGNVDLELQNWKNISRTSRDAEERDEASAFVQALEPVARELEALQSARLGEMEDSANNILGYVDDLWKLDDHHYPQDRMERLLSVSSTCFAEAVAKRLQNASIWKANANDANFHLSQATAACNAWIDECQRMTSLFWRNDMYHPWKGEPYQPQSVIRLRERIHQIDSIMQAARLVVQLVPATKHILLEPDNLFRSFQDLEAIPKSNSLMDNATWKGAVALFNERFTEVEKEAGVSLRSQLLSAANFDRDKFLGTILEYKELIQRPRIRRELGTEGQELIRHTKSWLQELGQSLVATRTASSARATETLREIRVVRQLESQVSNIQKAVHLFVNDLDGANALEQEAITLLAEVQDQANEIFDSWSRNMLSGIRDQSMSLSSDSPVVTFDENKLMKINYDHRLVNFVEEVRVLSSMGFKVSPQIVHNSKNAESFMQQAKELEQIATFHNNIGDSMMPCLKPLMLEAAISLSSLVQEQNVVTWTQVDNVNNYIRRLQVAVQRLVALNQQLTQCHEQIQVKVLRLFDVDLVTQQNKWRDILKEIRLIMGTVEAQGFKHLHLWRLFWDHQLYKALDSQYASRLTDVHNSIGDIHIELDFKKQNLQFKPQLEDVRRDYYSRLRKFLSLPLNFKGLLDPAPPNFFSKIVEKHSDRFGQVYAASGRLFTQLENFKDRYKESVAPSAVELESLIERELSEPQDWDTTFQMAKKKREETSIQFNDDERVGCFIIGLGPLQREIDYLHRRYWDALSSTLYASIHKDATAVDSFVQDGILLLEGHQENDVSHVNSRFNDLLRGTPEIARTMKRAENKVDVLSRWTQDRVEMFTKTCLKWESFNVLLSRHKEAISQQLHTLKSNSQSQIIQFTSQVDGFSQKWQKQRSSFNGILQSDGGNFDQLLSMLRSARNEWNELMKSQVHLNANLEKVGEKPIELSAVAEVETDLSKLEKAWDLHQSFTAELNEMGEEEWLTFRNKIPKFDEYLESWTLTLNESEDREEIVEWLKVKIDSYKAFVPILKLARGETFTERHWSELLKMAGLPSVIPEHILFLHLLQSQVGLTRQLNALKELNGRAAGESLVRQALSELEQWEAESRWTLSQHVDSGGHQLHIVKEFKELLNRVGENLSLIQSVKDSSYYQAYSDRITLWETKMTDLDFYLRQLSLIQLKWLYLEPVFNRGALLKEASRFKRLDGDFRFILVELKRDSRVTAMLRIPNLRTLITTLIDQVSRCQKSLFEFLEDKRSKFARFYFLGDEDLLDIVGQAASKPAVVQPHLKKLFAGIHSVLFSSDQRQIVAIASQEGERVELKTPIPVASEDVEFWLNRLVIESRSTLQVMLRECVLERQRNAVDLARFPSQILCLAEAIVFTERCENAIALSSTGLAKLKTEYQNQLASYTSAPLLQNSGSDEQGVLVLKLQALIMDIIHYIDVIEQVIKARCRSPTDWTWQKQLRFYMKNGLAVAKMVSTEIEYTYEYQGNVSKLVHTPLTDKCYLTITLALRMGLGGNPYGPAGTGKTESVKALGSLLGRQVLVFNCDEGLDVKSMGRIFVGLAKSGAWGCFDEFNRLDENTLSTVSTLIQAIQVSLKNKHNSVTLLGSQVDISPHTGIYITLNPAGKEYGGRQKLPDNLKLLFRPVVMSEPDLELIAEVILYSQGFRNAQVIGKKLVDIFHLAHKLLSRQQHYDWGLRALKSVLRTAGDGLRSSVEISSSGDAEINAVVRALHFNTLSKLTMADSALFLGLVADIFPNVQQSRDAVHSSLVETIATSCQEMGLFYLDRQVKKILEVYEQAKQRIGVVIVGPPQTGKSTVCSILKKVLQQQKRKVQAYTMNPKSISRVQLLGQIDPATREWTDGVLTKIARTIVTGTDDSSWVVCDGDIDPEWIEALNSVLDDNRLLTMASGERIKFGSDVNFIFETHDLAYASPATISRMGVIYFSEGDIDFQLAIAQWLQKQPAESHELLKSLVEKLLYEAVDWISQSGECVMPVAPLTTIYGILGHLESCHSKVQFVLGLLKGGAANLNASSRSPYCQLILTKSEERVPDPNNPLQCDYDPKLDSLASLNSAVAFDLAYHRQGGEDEGFFVPTPSLHVAYTIIQPWLEKREHVLLVGPEACGKSLLVEHCLKKMRSTRIVILHCTASTTPQDVLYKLLQNSIIVSSSSGQSLCPREASVLVLYLKDLNIVVPDKWGTCQLTAFLEQVINYRGCYDSSGEWLVMDSIQIVATLNLNHSEGRFQLSPRFTSLLRVAAISEPQLKELEMIATAYLNAAVIKNSSVGGSLIKKMATFMVHFHESIRTSLVPENNFQTLFTTRCLTRWAEGMARYEIQWEDLTVVAKALGYEACRIYHDRLGSNDHRAKFNSISSQLFSEEWKCSLHPTGGITYSSVLSKKQRLTLISPNDWEKIVHKSVLQYGRENEALNIELLPELLQSVARSDRVLTGASANSLLLLGRSGVGRHTTIKLLSILHKARVMTPYPGKNYSRKQFAADLKSAIQAAGVDGELVYFLVEDHHFTDPLFYSMLDSLLASGEVPGIYTNEELEAILTPLKELAAQENYGAGILSFFAQRVRSKLRIIFLVDNAQSAYETVVETHPAMYKHSSTIWMDSWSTQSMIAVASLVVDRNQAVMEDLKKSIHIYDGLNSVLKCPRRYVSFIETFWSIFSRKSSHISEQQQRIQTGVAKLSEARDLVVRLQAEAGQQEQLLEQKQMEGKAALQKITDTIQSAGVKRGAMQELRSSIASENVALTERKQAIDRELAEIEPLLIEARDAVSDIRNEALAEIRSLRAPPEVIRDILEGVLRLMGILDTSWTSMKSFLAKRGIKEEIRSFDARKITTESRRAVEQLLARRGESFDARVAKRASAAAAPLAAWVHANVSYSRVLERIAPLEQEQASLRKNLQLAEDNMVQLSTGLDDVDKQVAFLREQLADSTRQASEIEIGLNKARHTLSVSQNLVHELADEYDRWRSQLVELSNDRNSLAIHALMAAAFINFLSCAVEEERRRILSAWHVQLQLNVDEKLSFSLKSFLTDEQELVSWRSEGLPSDDLAVENALAIFQGTLYPYVLDSTGRSIQWLLEHFKSATVEVTSQGDERFVNTVDLALRFGKILVVQDVNTIDPILFPILRHDYIVQGVRKLVRLGDKLVDWNENFRLFLFSRSNGIQTTSPHAYVLVNTINFNTTEAGLAEQLLAMTVRYENPQLEDRKKELLEQEEKFKMQLVQLEEKLLHTLGNSQGSILENQEVLSSLKELKLSGATISKSLKESVQLQATLEKERLTYNDLSQYGSRLYFAVRDLVKLNPCYQFSVSSFMNIYLRNLESIKVESGPEKMEFIRQRLFRTVYETVSRSLFKPDKIVAAVHILKEMKHQLIQTNEWDVFVGLKASTSNKHQLPNWVDESRSANLAAIKAYLPNIFSALHLDDTSLWTGKTSNTVGIPASVCQSLTPFQQILVTQALYPDRLISSLSAFLGRSLELQELFPATSNLRTMLKETSSSEPILVFLPGDGSGAYDMTAELAELANEVLGTESSYHEIAMGTDETEGATQVVLNAAKNGHWVCLKNVHLVSSWLPSLDRLVEELHRDEEKGLDGRFRLWMTSEPVSTLPMSLLQRSKKIASEAAQGMKRNLTRTLETWLSNPINGSTVQVQGMVVLAWFHAVVQERRNYVPQGWLKKHEFNDADLKAAVDVLDQVCGEIKDAGNRWDYIIGLLFNVIYGGRVDNNFDLQILESYLAEYFGDDKLGKPHFPIHRDVVLPLSENIQDYLALVRRLPEEDKSSYFGLPANIDSTVQYNQSLYLASRLKVLYQSGISSIGGDVKLLMNKLTPIFNTWKSLVQGTALLTKKESKPLSLPERPSPLLAFVVAESALSSSLVQTIHQSLVAINRSLKSNSPLPVSLMESVFDIATMKTPKSWFRLWEGPLQVERYLRSLVKRARALTEEWLPSAHRGQLLDGALDLSHLMNPEAFFSILRQHTARELVIPMDSLRLATFWDEDASSTSSKVSTRLTAKLCGIYIQGARMRIGAGMEECDADTPSWNPVPPFLLSWIASETDSRNGSQESIRIPLYVDEERQRLITVLEVPFTSGPRENWYRAGIALSLKD